VQPDVLVGTFGKALGVAGAFVVGPPELKALLINAGRGFIFSTGAPEPLLHMVLAALDVLDREGDALRARLTANTARLRAGLQQLGWQPLGDAHIVPIVLGEGAMAAAERAVRAGVLLTGIRYPTVPVGAERLRLTVSAAHTDEAIDRILDALGPKPRG
jgi:7-keto-8-aminopelargonate synthetase-like enzyme